ncbi:hypothetical protein [Halobacterium hubeiense]|uniref:hypothetical protein n=1 Tax=Halobacterium hubeiense TaxID=1407499 RepID=UPI003C753880
MTKEMDAPTRFFRESDHPFAEMYRKRVEQNRDLVVLVTDSSNDRGTGKTTETLRLAHGMDRTDEGLTTDKVAMDPRPLIQAYTEQPHMSGLALDESEVGLDKYKSGSAVNRAIRELVSTGRIEQKYLVLNAPADHLVDKDLKTLVDVWILVERRGFANVYRMDWSPHQGKQLTPHLGTIEWDPIPSDHQLQEVYNYLTDKKKGRLRGEDGDDFIKRSQAREMVEEAEEAKEQEVRDRHIKRMAKLDLNQSEIGDVVGLSRSRVSQILANGD